MRPRGWPVGPQFQSERMFEACRPAGPSPTSNSTCAPSARLRKPPPLRISLWANRSLFINQPGVMKLPEALSSLNHFDGAGLSGHRVSLCRRLNKQKALRAPPWWPETETLKEQSG